MFLPWCCTVSPSPPNGKATKIPVGITMTQRNLSHAPAQWQWKHQLGGDQAHQRPWGAQRVWSNTLKQSIAAFFCFSHCWLPDTQEMQGGEMPPRKAIKQDHAHALQQSPTAGCWQPGEGARPHSNRTKGTHTSERGCGRENAVA